MASTYKLTYFNGRGRAEPLRYLLAFKNVDYDDHRITFQEWAKLKPTLPFGKLPVLEVDGDILAETFAITRYVAKELSLTGKNNLEAAKADMFMDVLKDCFEQPRGIMEQDEEKKKALIHKFLTEAVPPCFSKLEQFLKQNGGSYFVGNDYTWADFGIACGSYEIQAYGQSTMDAYPTLASHMNKIHALPGIKQWVEKRPETPW